MSYIVVALLSAIFGFGVAALMCASGKASAEEELFRLYQTIADYQKILSEYKILNHENNQTMEGMELYKAAKQRCANKGIYDDVNCVIDQEQEIRYYRDKIKMLTEKSDKPNKVPQNETEVLKLLNEAIEMLWIIHEHTRKNKKFISEAINALHSARRSNYVNYVDWDTLKIGE